MEKYVNPLGQKLGDITSLPCSECGTLMVVVEPPQMFNCPRCNDEYHGDLEVIVTYGGSGLVKTRKRNVIGPDMPYVLRDLLVGVMKAIIEMEMFGGVRDPRSVAVFSDDQFKQI